MTPPPFWPKELAQHRLAGQGVAEGEASIVKLARIGDQPRLAQAPQHFEGRLLGQVAQNGQESGVEALAQHRCPSQKLLVALTQGAHPAKDHLLDGRRQLQRVFDAPATLADVQTTA